MISNPHPGEKRKQDLGEEGAGLRGGHDKGPVDPERPGVIPPAGGGAQPWGRWLSLTEDSCQAGPATSAGALGTRAQVLVLVI